MDNREQLILICGDEEYLKAEKKKEYLKKFGCEGSPDFNSWSGNETDMSEVLDLAETVPFFGELRVLLLDDTGLFRGTPDQALTGRFAALPETTRVIFTETAAEPKNALYKLVHNRGTVCTFTQVTAIRDWKAANASRGEIRAWIREKLKEAGKSIDSRALETLVSLSGYNMQNLETELEKLISYRDGAVTEADIRAVCSRTVQDRVFDMMDMKLAGNTAGALLLFEDMLSIRVEPMKIIYLFAKQCSQLFSLKELEARRIPDSEILSRLEIRDWQLRKLRERSRGISASDLRDLMELCADMETRIKNGDMPDRIAAEIILCS